MDADGFDTGLFDFLAQGYPVDDFVETNSPFDNNGVVGDSYPLS